MTTLRSFRRPRFIPRLWSSFRFLLFTTAMLVFASWAVLGYRYSVLDSEFLVYGQSVIVNPDGSRIAVPRPAPRVINEKQERNVITLERTACFGACPQYLLQIDSSGAVSFRNGAPGNRRQEQTSTITAEQLHDLVAGFAAIHFFELKDVYPGNEDLPGANIALTLDGKTKSIKHGERMPPGLDELERTIERTTNIHRWLHANSKRYSLQSSLDGSDWDAEDLTEVDNVRADVEARIKPGLTRLMQAAGGRGIESEVSDAYRRIRSVTDRVTDEDLARWTLAKIKDAFQQGDNVNAADETGWTALMIASVTGQLKAMNALLDAGALVNQSDQHGNTALIAAASARYQPDAASEIVGILLANHASVNTTNDQGETALMWAARNGNSEAIRLLLREGANAAQLDRAGHNALFYLEKAREKPNFNPEWADRYNRAEILLKQR